MVYQTALITGASSGLGRGLSLWFARKGVKVYAAARREAQLRELEAEGGGNITALSLDVARADEAHDRIKALDEKVGGFDLVIANAGVGEETYGKRIDWPVVKRMLDVNVTGAVATLCAALPGMVQRGRGHLVGMSSLAAFISMPRMSTYSASKSFLAMWLDGIRLDVERLGVSVTCLHPGFVKSEITAKSKKPLPFLLETDDAVERMGKAIERREQTFAFPWQMSTVVRAAAALPSALRTPAVRRLR